MKLSTCTRCGVPFEGTGACPACVIPDPHHDPEYRRNKRKRQRMARGHCEHCGAETELDCHHADGNRFNHKLENLRMWCEACHEPETQRLKSGGLPSKVKQAPHPRPLRLV